MEAPPVKNIVIVVLILGLFTLLVSLAPSELFSAQTRKDYADLIPDGTFESLKISAFNTTHLIQPTTPVIGYNEDWGVDEGFGHDMWFHADNYGFNDTDFIGNYHVFPFLFYYRNGAKHMKWLNNTGYSRGTTVSMTELNLDAEIFENETISEYQVVSEGQFSMKAYVGYNNTLYNHMLDAFNNDGLRIQFLIDMDEIGRTHGMSAWNIVSQLLFFQTPETGNSVLNFIAGLVLWTVIAILIFQLVLAVIKALPFT